MVKSDLPFGSEFSPSQIGLPNLLETAKAVGGDRKEFEARVYETYFKDYQTSEYNRRKLGGEFSPKKLTQPRIQPG